jgi:hypothetical protein
VTIAAIAIGAVALVVAFLAVGAASNIKTAAIGWRKLSHDEVEQTRGDFTTKLDNTRRDLKAEVTNLEGTLNGRVADVISGLREEVAHNLDSEGKNVREDLTNLTGATVAAVRDELTTNLLHHSAEVVRRVDLGVESWKLLNKRIDKIVAPLPKVEMSDEERTELRVRWAQASCVNCGDVHGGACPRVREIRYDAGGHIIRLMYWRDGEWTRKPGTITAQDVFPSGITPAPEPENEEE